MNCIKYLILCISLASCSPFINKHNTTNSKGNVSIDEKPHPKNSLEWWYLTGFLHGDNGKRYGIEYVFFNFRTIDSRNRYMINAAISIPEDSTFIYDFEAKPNKGNILDEVPLKFETSNYQWYGEKGIYELKANMEREEAGFHLNTTPTQPVTYHQGSGYVNYGDIAAAGYYSFPRLKTKGQLYINDDTINVEGVTWYDRQWDGGSVYRWSVAWDWTAINFSDDTELMLYRVNKKKGKSISYGGTYIKDDHSTVNLTSQDITFEPIEYWESPKSKKRYPIKWHIVIPKIDIDVTMTAEFYDQELIIKKWITLNYWEGMCKMDGTKSGKTIKGESYLEMNNR